MGKKQKCPEFENHERWLVSYADMLTLLFAVFVVLFALKEGGEPQVQKTAGSIQESFNTPLEDIPVDRKMNPMEQGYGIFDHFKGNRAMPSIVTKYPMTERRIRLIDDEMKRIKEQLEERLYGPDKFRQVTKSGQERVVSVERTPTGFKVRLLARYFYKDDGIDVSKDAVKDLDAVLESVKDLGRNIKIEGHTDSLPPKDKKYNNWDISALRASHVVAYMVTRYQFPQTKLSAAGFADTQPIAHNGTEAGRQLNRRIEIHVDYDPETEEAP